jgi:hypothetical protein
MAMATSHEKLNMINEIFSHGMEVLEILREQMAPDGRRKKGYEKNSYRLYEMSSIDKDGRMTYQFAGMKFFVKIRIQFRSERGFNQYEGYLDWGLHEEDHTRGENVKVSNEYKWSEKRIFLVETIDGSAKSHVLKDDGDICDCAEIIHNNIYNCLPVPLKSKEIE